MVTETSAGDRARLLSFFTGKPVNGFTSAGNWSGPTTDAAASVFGLETSGVGAAVVGVFSIVAVGLTVGMAAVVAVGAAVVEVGTAGRVSVGRFCGWLEILF